ncbi:putative glycosyltransferase [Tupanvirus soda lake]|uniref:Glycosyltransferase n=2 Tax=Tupanvirus TaxID=2094720 RepID=A0AC62ACN0_9VIRU|nr:putative glycosyltransferase [Tupanvirus soda lake]QKU35506.1 putative glycosyltransferase [Tupanvirus soda lake]
MSIANRYPIIKSLLDDKKSYYKNKWNIVFFKFKKKLIYTDLDTYLDELTIKNLSNNLTIENMYICTFKNEENKTTYKKYIEMFRMNLLEIPLNYQNNNTTKLLIIKKLLNENKNSIFINECNGCIDNIATNIFNDETASIHASIKTIDKLEDAHQEIAKKLGLDKIIDLQFIVIPYAEKNRDYINHALKIANEIKINNEELALNISLSITNLRFGNFIKNIDSNNIKNNTLLCSNDRCFLSKLRELYVSKNNIVNETYTNKLKIPYNNKDYIYYPYLDIDYIPKLFAFDESDMAKLKITEKYPNLINSNGFIYDIDNKYYNLMFKRFDDKSSGIFIKKEYGKIIIPKILHHIWLDGDVPNLNYTNAWGKMLRDPWKYFIWTEEKLLSEVLKNNRWEKIYINENNKTIKLLTAYLAILEKYGGFVIDSYTIPLKIIPDDMLMKKILISFSSEQLTGTKLSYRVMASVPGFWENNKRKIDHTAARRPFEGMNNFFIDLKMKQKEINNKNNEEHMPHIPFFFDKMYNILADNSKSNRLENIENIFLTEPDTIIYPSYYFNPSYYTYPKKLVELAVFVNLWKLSNDKNAYTKTDIKRTYKVTTQSILSKLAENPKDRLKNISKIE